MSGPTTSLMACILLVMLGTMASTEGTQIKKGLLLKPISEVALVKGKLTVAIKLQHKQFIEEQATLIFTRLREMMVKLPGTHIEEVHKRTLESRLGQVGYIFRQIIQHIPIDTLKYMFNLNEPRLVMLRWNEVVSKGFGQVIGTKNNNTVQRIRSKRSWFDAGGNFLHMALGVETGKSVDNKINLVKSDIQDIYQVAKVLEVDVGMLGKAVKLALREIDGVNKGFEKINERLNEINRYLAIQNMVDSLGQAAQLLLSICNSYDDKLAILRGGIVPSLISYNNYKKLIKQGSKMFPELKFPFFINSTNFSVLNELVKVTLTNDNSVFLIHLPYVSIKTFIMYKLRPFPIIGIKNKAMLAKNIPLYLAMRESEYFESNDLDTCTNIPATKLKICRNNVKVRSITAPTCAVSLFKNDTSTCTFEEIDTNQIFTEFMDNAWYILFLKPTIGTISCPGRENNHITTFKGIVSIKSPCSFHAQKFSLPTMRGGDVKLELDQFDVMPIQTYDINTLTLEYPINKFQEVKEMREALNMSHIKLKDLDYSVNKNVILSIGTVTYSSVVTIGIIVLIIIGIYLVRRKFQRYKLRSIDSNNVMRLLTRPGIYRDPNLPIEVEMENRSNSVNNIETEAEPLCSTFRTASLKGKPADTMSVA